MQDNEGVKKVYDKVMDEVKKTFKPEFINRLDEIIMFNILKKENMGGIVRIQLQNLLKRLQDKGFIVEFSNNLYKYLAETGYDPIYGARPLKRIIQREVENLLANKILKGEVVVGKKVVVDVEGEEVIIK